MFSELTQPDLALGAYPERPDLESGWAEWLLEHALRALPARGFGPRAQRRLLARVDAASAGLEQASAGELAAALAALREELSQRGLDEARAQRAFALVREHAARVLGKRPRGVQLLGGWTLLRGMLAEMRTGEGKTLTATLPAATAALAGVPVHVITANDYLAARDAEEMRPLYEALGLRVASVTSQESDVERRREAWRADVTYCTGQQLAFDYLKDRRLLGNRRVDRRIELERLAGRGSRAEQLLLRGLYFAIVDEADHVLIDEAGTPLVLAQKRAAADQDRMAREALQFAADLKRDWDFRAERATRQVALTPRGRERLDDWAEQQGALWASARLREELINQALVALHLLRADREYLVRDGKVEIIDPSTGRVLPDRSWQGGLHQMIEAKEGCPPSGRSESLARITYQRFFRRYLHLGGMTGTAREVRAELREVYGLRVVPIPTHRPPQLRALGDRLYTSDAARRRAVVARVRERAAQGRPVLVGTCSVAASERISQALFGAGIEHQLLNARQDVQEAEQIARAGEPGCITVATSMAGRGTDIHLSARVREAGGLHVISTECAPSGRVDRQLFGRAGRQGDPGSYELLCSLEDEVVSRFCARVPRALWKWLASADEAIVHPLGRLWVRAAQRSLERQSARVRRDLWRLDRQLADLLAFAGARE